MSKNSQGICGLTNIGNTCYGNAVLQALRHHIDLTMFFIQDKHISILGEKPSKDMIESYVHLLKLMWTSKGEVESTRPFWKSMVQLAVKKSYEQFQYPHPHDAHEFLGFLLDQFHEGLSQPVHMTLRSINNTSEITSALSFWKQSFEKGYSPLVELAFSLRRKCTRCEECGNESITWETFNMLDVSVPLASASAGTGTVGTASAGTAGTVGTVVEGTGEGEGEGAGEAVGPKNPNLIDLIISDGKGDTLEDYACTKCSPKKTKATVTRTHWRLGSWLIIPLKRFHNDGRRVNTVIDIPLETTFTSTFHPTTPEPSFRDTYELFATVNHHGVAGGGHYTAQAKNPITGTWNLFDDERSMQIQTPHIDHSAYILMYRKKSD